LKVLLTGATGRLGSQIARILDVSGNYLALNARNQKKLANLSESLSHCEQVIEISKDVKELSSLYEIIETTTSSFGGLDVLINNVACFNFGSVLDMSPEVIQNTIQTNLTSIIVLTRLALPHLITSKKGIIINISSTAGQQYLPGAATYCATKSALLAFSGSLFDEAKNLGVRVCTISPGQFTLSQPRTGATINPEEIAQVVDQLLHYPGTNSFPREITLCGT
jgi:short-subunit dehydrogenase